MLQCPELRAEEWLDGTGLFYYNLKHNYLLSVYFFKLEEKK